MTTQIINSKRSGPDIQELRGQILGWYDKHRRILPWRALDGQTPKPYHVWLSEIMLQQTTVTAVMPYYTKFLQKWPEIQDLAKAHQDEVMQEWAGLGYYARARNLHACAKMITEKYEGIFPDKQSELLTLPGVGDYTSAAITTIAFGKSAVVMDGNIERVAARLYVVKDPLPKSKPLLKSLTADIFENCERPGDLAQALMDLGATICTPKSPKCILCPINSNCKAFKLGIAETLPTKAAKAEQPEKFGFVYWITNPKGQVLLHRRPEKGMLGGMVGLPTSEWILARQRKTLKHLTMIEDRKIRDMGKKPVSIHHTFTHFNLELALKSVALERALKPENSYFWAERIDVADVGFPTLFKKAARFFMKDQPLIEHKTRKRL